MIHNTCIYRTVEDGNGSLITDSTVSMTYVNWDFSIVLQEDYDNTTGAYQFNLGNTDMLTLAEHTNKNDVVVISNLVDGDTDNTYSEKIVLQDGLYYYEHNIVDDGSLVETTDTADAVDESMNIVVKEIILNEQSNDMHSYFEVKFGGHVIYKENTPILRYLPTNTGEHKITHKAINKTTADITEKEWTIDVGVGRYETVSLDYIFYTKKKKILRAELPQYVLNTIILPTGW